MGTLTSAEREEQTGNACRDHNVEEEMLQRPKQTNRTDMLMNTPCFLCYLQRVVLLKGGLKKEAFPACSQSSWE